VPALPSSVLEPLWVQVAALLPSPQVHHPLGCHRPRIPDRLVFDKLIQVLGFGCGYRRIADHTCSATTCAAAGTSGSTPAWPSGSAWRCWPPTTACMAYSWSTWPWTGASPRHPAAARPPGQARPTAASRGGNDRWSPRRAASRWGRCPPRPTVTGDGLGAATLDTLTVVAGLPERPVVHLDAGYDYQTCRQVLAERGMAGAIATRGKPAPIQASRRWPVERTHAWATSTASCAGAPSAAESWSSSGWRWQPPRSSAAGCSAAPGAATAGKAALAAAHDRLLAQALSASLRWRCRRRAP
jgi:hypothetical protein